VTINRHPPISYEYRGKGFCSMCGEPVLRQDGTQNMRRHWHPDCASRWNLLTRPNLQRAALMERDRGICCDCGHDCTVIDRFSGERVTYACGWRDRDGRWWEGPYCPIKPAGRPWHADHNVPLWSVDRSAPDAIKYWELGNLVTRCEGCHKVKTASEAAERAAIRSPQRRLKLQRVA
jgi:5-methylcytosine-specific restriction endonuclease McrA